MAFRFKSGSCVAAGTFNIYIFQPQWLALHELLPRGAEISVQTNLSQPGFRFSCEKTSFTWTITPIAIVIESSAPDFDCGESIARILAALPHTPLVAVGNNTSYEADAAELKRLDHLSWLFRDKAPEGFPVSQKAMSINMQKDGSVYAIQASIEGALSGLAINVHTDLQEASNAFAQRTARSYFRHRDESKWLCAELFGVEIEL